MKTSPTRWRRGVLLAVGCLALSGLRGETPAVWDGSASHGFITSVLQRDDVIFASTDIGLYRAALSDKVWHRLPLPASAPMWGELAREAAASPVLVYYVRHSELESHDHLSGLYISEDSGQTWKYAAAGRKFDGVFVHSDGGIYADERMRTLDPPPRADKGSSAWTTDRRGRKLHEWHRLVVSHDLGKTWHDLSEGLSSTLEYYIHADHDHPELISVTGEREGHAGQGRHYVADDQTYHWKEIPWETWLAKPIEREYVFVSGFGGSNNCNAHADLSSLFKYPFLKWGNRIDVQAVQIETEKPAYTFRQHEPMPVELKVFFIFPQKPLRFADNEDETIFWELRGCSEKGDTFRSPAKIEALYFASPDNDAKLAAYQNDPHGRTVTLDNDHPYRRTVDLARLYQFPGPGKYRVQPCKEFCSFFKGDASFAGQVIDVTITP